MLGSYVGFHQSSLSLAQEVILEASLFADRMITAVPSDENLEPTPQLLETPLWSWNTQWAIKSPDPRFNFQVY